MVGRRAGGPDGWSLAGMSGRVVGAVVAGAAVVGGLCGLLLLGDRGSAQVPREAAVSSVSAPALTAAAASGKGTVTVPAPTLQCPAANVRTLRLKAAAGAKDSPTTIARRWLDGKGEGQPSGVRPDTFRLLVPGGAASSTATEGYVLLMDRGQVTLALLRIDRARAGAGWRAASASVCV